MIQMLKNGRTRKLFLKAFVISFVAMGCAALGAFHAMNSIVRPPDIPVIETVTIVPNPTSEPSQFGQATQPNSPDSYTGNEDEYEIPTITIIEERRPDFFTFLLFGLDERVHANSIMVAAYNAQTRTGYIISIPRDTKVEAQRNLQKINTGYVVGTLGGGGHEGGVNQLKSEVQSLVGFRPDFYAMVDFQAFHRIIDAVGGVEIYVPFHMRNDDPYQNLHIDIRPGLQVLDGETALHFARFRESNEGFRAISDYQRIENQQLIISTMLQELLTPASLFRIPEFISIFNEYVSSDLSYGALMWFANQARHINGVDVLQMYTLPISGTSGRPHWYELADEEGVLELVNRTINPLARDMTSADLRIAR